MEGFEPKIVMRVIKEIQEVNEGDAQLSEQIYVEAIDDSDIRKLKGFIRGPPDTPYQNGVFNLKIKLPNEYPFRPPDVRFETKVYHPNVRTSSGHICLDILDKAWTPSMSLKSMLLSLQLLLQDPRPEDPLEIFIAQQLRRDKEEFNKSAFYYTGEYALTPEERSSEWKELDKAVTSLMEKRRMSRNRAISTLARNGWNEAAAKRRREEVTETEADEEGPTSRARARTSSNQVDGEDSGVQADGEQSDTESFNESDGEIPNDLIQMLAAAIAASIARRSSVPNEDEE